MPILNANDINLHYETIGNGPPLLFIHGLGGSYLDWEYQIDHFKEHFTVLTIDLRGHGQTDKPTDPYSVELFAKDIAAFIQFIAPQGLHVIGHSLGGMVAFQLALDFPPLVKSLTIINSSPAVIFPGIKSQLLFYWRAFDIRLFGLPHLGKHLAKMLFPKPQQDAIREKFLARWIQNSPEAYLNTLKVFRGWNVMARLKELQVPTLIITADQDYTPVAYKQMYVRLIPNAELVVIPNSRHITIADQPELFNEALMGFLLRQESVREDDPLQSSGSS